MSSDLIQLIQVAEKQKPLMGETCNHCGWCCLTEVCDIGVAITGSSQIPCKLLKAEGDKHYCMAAEGNEEDLGLGSGCCSETQSEAMNRLIKAG